GRLAPAPATASGWIGRGWRRSGRDRQFLPRRERIARDRHGTGGRGPKRRATERRRVQEEEAPVLRGGGDDVAIALLEYGWTSDELGSCLSERALHRQSFRIQRHDALRGHGHHRAVARECEPADDG